MASSQLTRPDLHGRPWRRLRAHVLERDAEVCHVCHLPGATTVDHIIPVARGGDPRDPSNLAACHVPCNSSKGARSVVYVPPSRIARPIP